MAARQQEVFIHMNEWFEGFTIGDLLYENAFAKAEDVAGFRMEGPGEPSFPLGRMRLESRLDASEGQKANFVFWCPEVLPDSFAAEWDFWPIREPGLCMLFFAATGRDGQDVLDPSLSKREGIYDQYHHGDINAYHIAYFRRALPDERAFHVSNLRKSYGLHLVAQGADPIPSVDDAKGPYRIRLLKCGPDVRFSIGGLPVLSWTDDEALGPVFGAGRIGFRQLAPLIAEYANLKVYSVKR